MKSPEGESCYEPGESSQTAAVLQSDLSGHFRKKEWSKLSVALPASVLARLNGSGGAAHPSPLCTLGLPQDAVRELFRGTDVAARWDASFEMGRARFNSKCCAVWRVLFESFVPL